MSQLATGRFGLRVSYAVRLDRDINKTKDQDAAKMRLEEPNVLERLFEHGGEVYGHILQVLVNAKGLFKGLV